MYGSILLTSIIGGLASAFLALDAGAGLLLCLLAYGIGGAVSLVAAAGLHLAFPEGDDPIDGPRGGPPRGRTHAKLVRVRVEAPANRHSRR